MYETARTLTLDAATLNNAGSINLLGSTSQHDPVHPRTT